ncbi:hypothetical protein BCR43DRAFT_490090 [Syncephalastrum racemosum]|uniref:Ubiquitin-like domain-containing protein n=1 Tax=Syncephalastrum racemosum TaxID=13706 RepID=A0A1X2HFF4_SYNRA|nr:hypothetical protein BCR43DRAFT_490090 [Syncephalastrum racemosum]
MSIESSSSSISPEDSFNRLTVQVRSPSLSETLTVHITRSATVNALKREITLCHPAQPNQEDQRIIYAGRLLHDDQTLAQILQKSDTMTMPTFHLVVKPLKATEPSATATKTQPLSFPTASAPSQTIPTTEPPSMSSGPEHREMPQQQHSQYGQFSSATGINPHIPTDPAPLPGGYQLVAINGQYYLAPVLVPSDTPILTQRHHQQHQQQQQQRYEPQQPQQPQRAQAGRPLANPVRIQPMRNATSIWLALKLIFVLFIVCQDASIERILISHVVAVVFFLYQTGRLRFAIHRVHVNDQPQPPQPPQQPAQQRPAQPGQPDRPREPHHQPEQQQQPPSVTTPPSSSTPAPAPAAGSPQEQQGQEQPAPAPAPRPATLIETVRRGTYTFFASLWPNYGQDPRIAQAIENGQQEAWEGL